MNTLFCAPRMKKKGKIYTTGQRLSSLLMILTLLWLTVSVSYVYSSQEEFSQEKKALTSFPGENEEESANPFGNNTEEKNPGTSSFSEEFLHHPADDHSLTMVSISFEIGEHARLYVAFHGELLVPPPNQC